MKNIFLTLSILLFLSCTNEETPKSSVNELTSEIKKSLNLAKFESKNISKNLDINWQGVKKTVIQNVEIFEIPISEKYKSRIESAIFNEERTYEIISVLDSDEKQCYFVEIYTNKTSKSKISSLSDLNGINGMLKIYTLKGDFIGYMAIVDGIVETNEAKLFGLKTRLNSNLTSNQVNKFPMCSLDYSITTEIWIDRYQVYHTSSGVYLGTTYLGSEFVSTSTVTTMISWACGTTPDAGFIREYNNQYNYVNVPNVVVVSPETPINIQNFLACLNRNASATVTLSAHQPLPGYSYPYWGSVGHTMVTISQGGRTLSFGFYPANGVGIFSSVQGVMGNDANHIKNISVTGQVSALVLTNIINLAINYGSQQYNLFTNNCTDFGISVGNLMGWGLPDCYRNFLGNGGSNPGTFGEYLRTMTLPAGTTRNTATGYLPANVSCQ